MQLHAKGHGEPLVHASKTSQTSGRQCQADRLWESNNYIGLGDLRAMVGDPEACCPAANAARVELISFSSTMVWRSNCGLSAICADTSQFSACLALDFEDCCMCRQVKALTGRSELVRADSRPCVVLPALWLSGP